MTNKSAETKFALLETKQESMSQDIEEIKYIVKSFDEKLDKALEKKADYWVERAMTWFIYLVMGAVITALVYLVIKQQ